jgi:hypothetical protein
LSFVLENAFRQIEDQKHGQRNLNLNRGFTRIKMGFIDPHDPWLGGGARVGKSQPL